MRWTVTRLGSLVGGVLLLLSALWGGEAATLAAAQKIPVLAPAPVPASPKPIATSGVSRAQYSAAIVNSATARGSAANAAGKPTVATDDDDDHPSRTPKPTRTPRPGSRS